MAEDPAIEAGSVVVVPSSAIRVYVAGRVARPGMVELMQGATCLDAIAAQEELHLREMDPA